MNNISSKKYIVSFVVLLQFLTANLVLAKTDSESIWEIIPAETLAKTPFLSVDKKVILHDVERRNFVSVPLDYANKNGRQIDIFYRLMPSKNANLQSDQKPILVVINGGPGASSSGYRALDYDYQTGEGRNSFDELDKCFRILAIDQRGTGNSAPLDLDNPKLSAVVIAKYFDSDEHARDHAAVIDKVIPKGQPFFILARSYGGHIGFNYIALGDTVRQPNGFILASAIQPDMDGATVFSKRREKQLALNYALLEARPGIDKKLNQLRHHLKSLDIEPNLIHGLWSKLGQGKNWMLSFEKKLDELSLITNKAALTKQLTEGAFNSVNLLNYVLSSSALTPGYTDRTLTKITSARVPFENWMLDENWTLNQIGNDGSWREKFINQIDKTPPPPSNFLNVEQFKVLIQRNQLLFTFGSHDGFLEPEFQLASAKRFNVLGHTQYKVFNGGHGAAFSEEGAKFVFKWANGILNFNKPTKSYDFKWER